MTRRRRRSLIALGIAVAIALILLNVARIGLLSTWQAQGSDFLFKAKAGEQSSRVGIVAIDDRSLRELAGDGRVFTWPRSHYAKVISALAQAGVRVVVMDVLFDAPSAEDDILAGAMAGGNVVLPVAGELPAVVSPDGPLGYDMLASPVPSLARAAVAVGHVNVHPDGDGTVRRQQLVISSQGQEVPSLALMAAARYLRRPSALEGPPSMGTLPFAGRAVPIVDGRRGMQINYAGAPYQPDRPSPFAVVSFVDILRGKADLSPLKDRVVLIGLMATGFADDFWTPPSVSRKMPGVEIHANAVDTILRPAFLRRAGELETVLAVVLFSIAAGLGAFRLRILAAAGVALAIVIAYFLGASVLFDRGVLVNMVYPPLAPLLSFAAVTTYRVIFVESDQRAARRLLSGYLSPAVMFEVLKEPDQLRLGGEKRIMTVLFSDIRGFTTYSEQIEPEALARFLNEYLTEMSAEVFEHQGVVDKYMGDGIIAFWGAPVVQADHARRACLTALGMMRRLKRLHVRWRQNGIPDFEIGIGIHTGTMSVGNMGSQERFSYTVIGDAVNLTSRIEGLNKLYGTSIVISEATLQASGGGLEHRFLDLVAVKGKKEPVAVYELLPPLVGDDPATRSSRDEMLKSYQVAMQLSTNRRWQEAGSAFQRLREAYPADGPAAFHAQRCAELAGNPPPADWDGVYVAKTK
ncbi:MAG: adenylate/guanylate cyclase domain-containing protein [Chloroflexi bacterium]|nr:adenylate/guanylate cyclase domain-containing protein [Chloroflexota bacterium]